MTDSAGNAIAGAALSSKFVNVDNRLHGGGTIGGSAGLTLINEAKGVIDADGTSAALIIETEGAASNLGTMEGTGAPGLRFVSTNLDNSGAVKAKGGVSLTLSTITNIGSGAVSASGGGIITLNNSGVAKGALTIGAGSKLAVAAGTANNSIAVANFQNGGLVTLGNGGTLALTGAITNEGEFDLDRSGATTTLLVGAGGVTFNGAGAVELSDSASNVITSASGTAKLTNNDILQGAGNLGGGDLILFNGSSGVIDATGAQVLKIVTGSTSGNANHGKIESTGAGGLDLNGSALTNYGAITATGAGALVLDDTTITNAATGTLTAGSGAKINLTFATVSGGAISVATGATLTALSSLSSINAGSFINRGVTAISNGAQLTLGGKILNAGALQLNSAGQTTTLQIGNVTLGGGGKLQLSDNLSNIITGASATSRLTNSDNTITGAGSLGGGDMSLDNAAGGVIDATGANALVIATGVSSTIKATNEGTIESTGAGGLDINGTALTNTGAVEALGAGALTVEAATIKSSSAGKLQAVAGATIALKDGDIEGGALTVASGANLTAVSSLNTIAAASFSNAGITAIDNAAELTIRGAIDNAGKFQLNSTGGTTELLLGANTTFSGGGSLLLSNNASNIITGQSGATTLTNQDNHISGAGQLGGGSMTLVNGASGVISNAFSTALTIDAGGGPITNQGFIQSLGSGGVAISGAIVNTGKLIAYGGNLSVGGAVTGAGVVQISGATASFASSFSENVAFVAGTGKLKLAESLAYQGTITGFAAAGATTLDLGDIAFISGATKASFVKSASGKSGVLTVTDGTNTAKITLAGDFSGYTFAVANDGAGDTLVTAGAAPAVRRFAEAMARFSPESAGPLTVSNPGQEAGHRLGVLAAAHS
jgi:hypothetical protein